MTFGFWQVVFRGNEPDYYVSCPISRTYCTDEGWFSLTLTLGDAWPS